MKRKTKSPFKLKLMEFLTATAGETKVYNLDFSEVLSEEEVKAYVGQMRVELSRARAHVKKRDLAIKPFKMLIERVEDMLNEDGLTRFTRVILRRAFDNEEVHNLMEEDEMPGISAGKMLVGG